MLRPYQQEAHDAAIEWMKQTTSPAVMDLATGSGKSHVIAAIAHTINDMTGKRVLCLAPNAKLVTQNHEKYLATGNEASIFSASAGSKCLRHDVVFGTPVTVKNKIRRFGAEFALIIIDEAHGLTPTIRTIIDGIRQHNELVRVIGLSATPYRLGDGYIYATDWNGKPMQEAKDPYFARCIYRVPTQHLIDQGYLTPPVVGKTGEHYDTLGMELNSRHQFDAKDIDRAFHGHGRLTSAIVADVVAQSRDRNGVMLFAQTVQHANEIMASLPPSLSALITGEVSQGKREEIFARVRRQEVKYLVSVETLTTGFDMPHIDVIAMLRATESVALFQQIMGRGMRLHDGKADFLLLDYAENIERHCPDGDLFNPEIKSAKRKTETEEITAECPDCGAENEFTARENPDGYKIDENGYFLDLRGKRLKTEDGEVPGHMGRRCFGMVRVGAQYERCHYRWTGRKCENCQAENDIASRYCHECKHELVDPNEKLRMSNGAALPIVGPTDWRTEKIVRIHPKDMVSRKGNEMLRVDWVTERCVFTTFHVKKPKQQFLWAQLSMVKKAIDEGAKEVTYRKNKDSLFYEIKRFGYGDDERYAIDDKPESGRDAPAGVGRAVLHPA